MKWKNRKFFTKTDLKIGKIENTQEETVEEVVGIGLITVGFSFQTLQEERWAIERDIVVELADEKGFKILV